MNIVKATKNNFDQLAVSFLEDKLKTLQSAKKGTISVALSGGSTPMPILKKLSEKSLDWKRFSFFIVDERCVPIDNNQSNYGNIKSVFFDKVKSNHFPIITDSEKIEESIDNFKSILFKHVSIDKDNFPIFDLILLGMGEDGHTASLFPNTLALDINDKIVVKNDVPQLNTTRVTLTYTTIIKSLEILVLIKGDKKRHIFEEMSTGLQKDYPMQRIVNERKDLNWIIEY